MECFGCRCRRSVGPTFSRSTTLTVSTQQQSLSPHLFRMTSWPLQPTGSGELDCEEFMSAVRENCGLAEEKVSVRPRPPGSAPAPVASPIASVLTAPRGGCLQDDELEELFCLIDTDGSSAIDAGEFYEVLTAETAEPEMTYEAFKRSMFELADVWSEEVSEESYTAFLGTIFQAIACPTGLAGLDDVGSLIGENGEALVQLRDVADVETLIGSDGEFLEVRYVPRNSMSGHQLIQNIQNN